MDVTTFRISHRTTFQNLKEAIEKYWNIQPLESLTLLASNWARLDALMDAKVKHFFKENTYN